MKVKYNKETNTWSATASFRGSDLIKYRVCVSFTAGTLTYQIYDNDILIDEGKHTIYYDVTDPDKLVKNWCKSICKYPYIYSDVPRRFNILKDLIKLIKNFIKK